MNNYNDLSTLNPPINGFVNTIGQPILIGAPIGTISTTSLVNGNITVDFGVRTPTVNAFSDSRGAIHQK